MIHQIQIEVEDNPRGQTKSKKIDKALNNIITPNQVAKVLPKLKKNSKEKK